ncbi:MAG: hypothetical protein RLZZ303_1310 [Candidatus Hydrogenedentota bacterium]|jgi:hypothetical protein
MTDRGISTIARWRLLGLASLFLLPCATILAATLTVESADAPAGERITIEVSLTPEAGEEVAGMQFDLNYPAPVASLIEISPGPSATQSAKLVSSNPLGPGRHRIIVAGINQSPIPAGAVVLLELQLSSTAPPGSQSLTVAGVVLSDPGGRRVPSTVQNGALLVPGTPSPPPPAGCACNAAESDTVLKSQGNVLILTLVVLSCLAGGRPRNRG